jgi:phosphate-selective porin OprO/OprP
MSGRCTAAGVGLMCACFASALFAEEEAPVAEIPLPREEVVPAPEPLQWNLIGDLQGDFTAATSSEEGGEANVRRARLGLVLDWGFDWRVQVSGDFGKYSGLRDLFVEYRGLPVYLAAGRMVEPFGLLQGGSGGAALMERPQPTALGPGYGVGFQGNYSGRRWGLTVGAFDATQNNVELGGRREEAVSSRLTGTPFRSESTVIHLGASVSRRNSGDGFAQFDAIPETSLLEGYNTQSLIFHSDSDSPGDSRYWIYGAESAWRLGSLMLQAEYLWTRFDHVNTRNPSTNELEAIPSPRYHGYYVELSWALTGEHRDYSTRRGVFGGIYPDAPFNAGGAGAFEVAVRGSVTDLRYDIRYHGPTGDFGEVGSVGINWYPRDEAKVMLDFLQIRRTSHGGVGVDVSDPANPSRTDWIIQGRVQWYFVYP